jgi:hypothetical protein
MLTLAFIGLVGGLITGVSTLCPADASDHLLRRHRR